MPQRRSEHLLADALALGSPAVGVGCCRQGPLATRPLPNRQEGLRRLPRVGLVSAQLGRGQERRPGRVCATTTAPVSRDSRPNSTSVSGSVGPVRARNLAAAGVVYERAGL